MAKQIDRNTVEAAIADAVVMAEKIMQNIDRRAATPADQVMTSNSNYSWKTRGG
jgi:hypothetical protein